MALSGSMYTNVGSHWRLQIEWSATQDVADNQSTVTAKMYWIALDGYGAVYSSATKDGAIIIDGTTYTFSGAGLAGLSANQKKLIATKSKTITHDADGTKDFTLDGYFDAEVTLGSYVGRIDLTAKSFTLNTIPRKSTLSSSPSFTAGSDFTITVSRASSSFSHKAYIDVQNSAGTWVFIKSVDFSTSQTSLSSSFSTTDKTKIFETLAGASSRPMRINLHTYSGSTSLGYNTYSGTVTAPNASTGKISNPANVSEVSGQGASTVYIDQAITIGITRSDSEFTHTLTFRYGNSGQVLHTKTGVTTSYTWTPTQAEMDTMYGLIPNDIEFDGQLDITTYYNGEIVRSATAMDINFRVRNAEPTFASAVVYYEDNNATSKAITGDGTKIIQNVSSIKVLLPATSKAVANKGASISSYIAILGGQEQSAPYSTSDIYFYFNPINASVDQTLTIKAIDSRGFATEIARTVTMIPYQPPVLNGQAKRKNGFENQTDVSASGTISAVTIGGVQKNSVKSIKYRYKKTTDATSVSTWAVYTNFTNPTLSGVTYSTAKVPLDFDNTLTYNVEFLVEDQFGSKTMAVTVSTGKPILFIDAVKKTVGIGKFSTSYMLDVGGDANFDGKLNVKGVNSLMNGLDINWYNIKNVWEIYTGRIITSSTSEFGGEVTTKGGLYVLTGMDASNESAGNGLTVGDKAGMNLKFDGNEIVASSGTAQSTLHLQTDGGRVSFGNNTSTPLHIEGGEIINENYILASLANGWVNYSGTSGYQRAGYWKDKNGVVHLAGLIKGGTVTNGTTLFTLPVGYRPANQHINICYGAGSGVGSPVRVDVHSSGAVVGQTNLDAGWTSLAGISFKAEQ
jgi:Siphovirus protein of unknown function (DUF859)